jgi:protein involved in polysaccharide export with SLBB domain
MGEVQKPGEYRITDGTNILELIAKAEGTTEYANLSKITIKRINYNLRGISNEDSSNIKQKMDVIKVDLNDFLKKDNSVIPPTLKPRDIVMVPRNRWYNWRLFATIIRDLSVPVGSYLLYLRIK